MKLSGSPSRIVGVQLGEATLNLIHNDRPPLKVKFALIDKDGGVCGFVDMAGGWSETALTALRAFADAIEDEALNMIFEAGATQAPVTSEAVERSEPPQF